MENSIKMMKQIESTHRGLGISVLLGEIAFAGEISTIFLGEKGTGKGTTISAVKTFGLEEDHDMIIDNLTLTEMGNNNQLQHCYDTKMVWRIKEWSTMNRWNRELFLTIGAKIITDREYYHFIGMSKGSVPTVIDIKNTDLVCMVGIQPLKMSRMMRENENWESLASDRFIKWVMINALRKESLDFIPDFELPEILDDKLIPEFKTDLKLTRNMLHNQISPERIPIFAKKLLTGYARLENNPVMTLRDELDFVKLFKPFIEIYPKFVYTRDISEESELAVGSLRLFTQIVKHDGITIDELQETFSVYNVKKRPELQNRLLENAKEMISRHSQLLLEKGLVTKVENSPARFYMARPFEEWWEWYRGITT